MEWLLAVLTLPVFGVRAPLDVRFAQVAPAGEPAAVRRSPDRTRAVVLLHGLKIHPFNPAGSTRAELSLWQKPNAGLVTALAREADVYSFAYAQHVRIDDVADYGLAPYVESLRTAGYTEIVLVGHSAGGLIARLFVEDHPKSGVTKVIQVCAPNGGTSWAKINLAVRQRQEAFLSGLTREARTTALQERSDRCVPEGVEFVCVVGQLGRTKGDGLVTGTSQWTEELQEQGVPVVTVPAVHMTVMMTNAATEAIVELVKNPQPRWKPAEVEAARKRLKKLFPPTAAAAKAN
jgi:hypothetical protein